MEERQSKPPIGRLYSWGLQRLYNEFSWAYEAVAWCVSGGHWASWRERVVAQLTGQRVLEIGFGTGRLLATLADAGFEVFGVDLSPSMARRAAKRMRCRGRPAACVQQARAQQLPYRADAFDSATCTFPTNFALSSDTMREIYRVLRPGGRLVLLDGGFHMPSGQAQGAARVPEELGDVPARLPYDRLLEDAGFQLQRHPFADRLYSLTLIIATKPEGTDEAPAARR